MSYAVKLDVFEGPLDLLLQLVSKERVDVAEVSVSQITDEFLGALKGLEEMSLDQASAFLVVAATLLELKTIKLLPKGVGVDPELAWLLEERDRLLHRLIEYSTFKQAAQSLGRTMLESADSYVRIAPLPAEIQVPELELEIDLTEIVHAARAAFAPKPLVDLDLSHVTPIKVSVSDMISRLRRTFEDRTTIAFTELIGMRATRIDVVMAFLAVLEMFKSQAIEVEQSESFGELIIRPRSGIGRDS